MNYKNVVFKRLIGTFVMICVDGGTVLCERGPVPTLPAEQQMTLVTGDLRLLILAVHRVLRVVFGECRSILDFLLISIIVYNERLSSDD